MTIPFPAQQDYYLTIADASLLVDIIQKSDAERHAALLKLPKDRLVWMFAEFIGLANAVVANNREMVELILIQENVVHPHRSHQVNLPTIAGALTGVENAALSGGADVCGSCAFRLGTVANQCETTAIDVSGCLDDDERFLCHEDVDDADRPKHSCRGWVAAMKLKREVVTR